MIITVGKELLNGYCQNVKEMKREEYFDALKLLQSKIPENLTLCSIAMTPSSSLEAVDYLYLPKILEHTAHTKRFLDPACVFNNCIAGKDLLVPNADFVIFDKKDEIAVLAYSRTAPVIVFECEETGKKAIGVILRKALKEYGMYIIDTIVKHLGGKVKINIVMCTGHEYKDMGTIPGFIEDICMENEDVIDIKWGIDTENNPNYYGDKDSNNNAVILF